MKFALRGIASLALAAHATLALAAGPAEAGPKTEMSIQLPPFIIEQPAGPSWRYLEIPRFEILARGDNAMITRLALTFHRANQLLGLILPDRFQMAMDAPQTLIFYDDKLWPPAEREAVADLLGTASSTRTEADPVQVLPRVQLEPTVGAQSLGLRPTSVPSTDSFLGNLMLSDVDSMTTFALVSEATLDPATTYLTPAYVDILLQGRAPSLPEWFRSGFLSMYRRLEFRNLAVVLRTPRWDGPFSADGGGRDNLPEFLAWPDFFAESSASRETHPSLWTTQTMLFIQWALDPDGGRANGFWKFVERTAVEPATESVFEDCFGCSFGTAGQQLGAYTIKVNTIRWVLPEERARLPAQGFEDASPRQIARIKGEWERLETRYVRKNRPDLEPQYLALARRTLRKPYDRGDRDPRLLASLGLLELEAGDKAAATELLAEAVRNSVVRPRAGLELARLRYRHEFGRSPRNDGKFTSQQTAAIVEPLLLASRQAPPLREIYELLAHVYENSVDAPAPAVLVVLAEGKKFFPHPPSR